MYTFSPKGRPNRLDSETLNLFAFIQRHPYIIGGIFELMVFCTHASDYNPEVESYLKTFEGFGKLGQELSQLKKLLRDFFSDNRVDHRRGWLLEEIVAFWGPFTFSWKKEKMRRECYLCKNNQRLFSRKDIDVVFICTQGYELHECKANLVSSLPSPHDCLDEKAKRVKSKLDFLQKCWDELVHNSQMQVKLYLTTYQTLDVYEGCINQIFKFYNWSGFDIMDRDKILNHIARDREC